MLETPRNIDKSLRGGNERSKVKSAKKSGLGNALGLLTIILVATNFDKIKNLVTGFINGDTFKSIVKVFDNIKNFFVNLFEGFKFTQKLFGEKYEEFVAFKDEKVEEFEKLAEKFDEIGEKFKELREFAIKLAEKFNNFLGLKNNNVSIDEEKEGLEQYGFNDDDFKLIMGDDGNYRVVPNEDSSNLGLTNYSDIAMNNRNGMNFNPNTFDNIEPKNSSFDFSQYNDDETKKKVVMITKTNTVIT